MRVIRFIVLSLMLLVAYAQQTLAAADVLCHLNIDEGLPGDCVYKVVKDSRGYMWIGTNNGLALYDGRKLISIASHARRGDNLVHDIVEMPDGSMAVGMRRGLWRVSFPQLRAERIEAVGGSVNALSVSGDTLLAGGSEGLKWVNMKTGAAHQLTLGTSIVSRDNNVLDLVRGSDGAVWVVAQHAVYRLRADLSVERLSIDAAVAETGLRCAAWSHGRLYLGTSGKGLYQLDVKNGISAVEARPLTLGGAGGVVFDLISSASRLYVATDGGGAYVYDIAEDRVVSAYKRGDGSATALPTNSVYTFWYDEQLDVNWFGFFREGLVHSYRQRPLAEAFRCGDFDSRNEQVRSFCLHGDYVAVGTRDGLYLADRRQQTVRYFGKEQLGGSNVMSIVWFDDRFVLATYDGGICAVLPETGRCLRPHDAALNNGVYMRVMVLNRKNGTPLLMALSAQITLLNRDLEVVDVLTERNSELKGDILTDAFVDKSGKVWLSSESGLALFDPTDRLVKKSGFPRGFFHREPVLKFGEWRDKGVLAAGERMLYRCREDLTRWDSLSLAEHLDVNSVTFVVPQGGRYWIGTDRGLFSIDTLFTRFYHIGRVEGLSSLFCNPQSWQMGDDGSFWFSTRSGIYRLSSASFASLNLPAVTPVVLAEVCVGDRFLTAGQCVACTADRLLEVGWNMGTEQIVVRPLIMDFAHPKGRYVEWQIDDSEMHAASERQPIMIDGLSLGSHVLRIYLPGSKEPVEYRISVKPAPLFWFEVLFVVALVIIVVLLWSYKKRLAKYRAARRRKHQLDMKLAAERSVADYQRSEERKRQEEEERKRNAMYQRSRSTEDENRQLLGQVRQLMEQQKLYRQLDLRVADVAAAVGCSPNKLSQMLSMYADVSFYDFVNDYRIEEFKRKALDKEFAHLTTLAIAESCGLKKTTFYAAFSKKEGCTPAEWKQLTESSSKQSELSSEKM